MPNLDFDVEGESQQQSNDYLVTSKVRRLIEDKNKLGPGCYEVKEETVKKSPKAA